jgi:hypothetical protein
MALSGNSYVANLTPQALTDVCPPPNNDYTTDELQNIFQGGVMHDTLTPDSSTGRIPAAQLQQHVQNLIQNGTIPPRPQVKVGNGYETDMNKLVPQDALMFNKMRDEYCFYEQRYRFALKKFLSLATSRDSSTNAAAQEMLQITKKLNARTNSVLEIMNYLAQSRVDEVNANKIMIDGYNKAINNKLAKLKQSYDMLSHDNVIVNTQKASVLYTEEKNNYTANQISVWAALNVVALATIFYVYRS